MQSKIPIILQREYLNIVRKRSFWLATFLVPFGFVLIFGIQIVAALFVEEENYTVLINSGSNPMVAQKLMDTSSLKFKQSDDSVESLKTRVGRNEDLLLLILPSMEELSSPTPQVQLTGKGNISSPVQKDIREQISSAIETYRMEQAGLSKAQLESLQFKVEMKTSRFEDGQEKSTNTGMATIVGFVMGFLMYMLMAIFGSILMQGVIEEKSNRIVEVIVSSVKPFELLMGKTVALALVGITQMLLWGILSTLVMVVFSFFIVGAGVDPAVIAQSQQPGMTASPMATNEIFAAITTFNWNVLWFFPLFFIGGFFLFGSLFAAAGASVDNIQDAQQFTLPITIPLILPMLFLQNIIQNPNGVFATVASLVPFFSPMTMMVRLSLTDVPWYEVVISLLLLYGSFIGTVWIAGRIYRVGILMYGKKPTFAEIFRWIRYNS